MSTGKPKVIKAYEKLDKSIQEQIKLAYPYGFSDNLISFTNKDGAFISALPFETDEKYYLIKMSVREAELLIEVDDDYNDDGYLKNSIKAEYKDKHGELEYMKDMMPDE